MNKDRIISDLRGQLEEAEEEIEYNVRRKEELKDKIERLEEELQGARDMYSNYFDQCKSLANSREELQSQLQAVQEELVECQEGNYYIQQYNHKLVKARDDADEALETVKKDKSKLESSLVTYAKENEKLKLQNKTIVANNVKSLQEVKSERDSMKAKFDKLVEDHSDEVKRFKSEVAILSDKISSLYKCDHCGKVFETRIILNNHISSIHTTNKQNRKEDKRVKCDNCGKPFYTKDDLQRHKIVKHKVNVCMEMILKQQNDLQMKISQQRIVIYDKILKLQKQEMENLMIF